MGRDADTGMLGCREECGTGWGAAEWDGVAGTMRGWRFLSCLLKGLEVRGGSVCGARGPHLPMQGEVCVQERVPVGLGVTSFCVSKGKKWRSKVDPTPQVSFFRVAEAYWKEKGVWGCPHPCQGGRGGVWSSRQSLLCQEACGHGAGGAEAVFMQAGSRAQRRNK